MAKKYRYISRIDSEDKHTHGWYVRVKVGTALYQKLFSDKSFDGKRKALNAALDYRDELERRRADVKPAQKFRIGYPFSSKIISNTGIAGISESWLKVRKRIHHVFQVSWRDNLTQPRNKKYYVSKYANRNEALADAIEFRSAKEIEMLKCYHDRLVQIKKQLLEPVEEEE